MVHLNSINVSSKIWWQSRNNCEFSRWWVGQIFINLTDRQQELKSAISIVHRALLKMVHPKAFTWDPILFSIFLSDLFLFIVLLNIFLSKLFLFIEEPSIANDADGNNLCTSGENFFFFFFFYQGVGRILKK